MATLIFFSLLLHLTSLPISSSSTSTLTKGSSLSVENPDDLLISRKGTFSAGFYPVGKNSFCFAIWVTKRMHDGSLTVVWMANRDQPVNGKGSKISFLENGNLILTDAGQYTVWATNTISNSSTLELEIYDSGNLILHDTKGERFWQSFDFPTDTLLANQLLTRQTSLISSRSSTNHSSGFYKFFFDNDNVLRLLFDGLDVSSIFWPAPWANTWENGRSTYNNSRIAFFNSSGYFYSTDDFLFQTSDFGSNNLRRLKMDIDGNIRVYSLVDGKERKWMVTWQAIQWPCKIHGICGANALCTYEPQDRKTGRKCTCIPGYKMKNLTDWTYGCESDFKPACRDDEAINYIELPHVEFYGYEIQYHQNYTFQMCRNYCSNTCTCMGFQFKFSEEEGFYNCYPKSSLLNGHRSADFASPMYIKLPKDLVLSYNRTPNEEFKLDCSLKKSVMFERFYRESKENATLQFMTWFATSVGGLELLLICIIWYYLYRNHRSSDPANQGYLQVGSGFRKFTYDEMKKATKNFSEEIGRGSGGIVYKGILSDQRVAAIKRLNEANQGEAEFLAEVSTIGKLNHMNLIEMWGYCLEGKHSILVYEYMENGSLEKSLTSKALNSKRRFDIAVGTARGLAYLHEECLEWVLHCDVKPQNVLLDTNFQPKVADFGLSKLFNRRDGNDSNFSKIRGTRGYMAPEWIFNLAITSKVDVYSYGVVVLEMVTGRSPMGGATVSGAIGMEQKGLVNWVREKMNRNKVTGAGIQEIIDPIMEDTYDAGKMKILVEVALQCVEEDKDVRPTMRQVVERLLQNEE